MMRLHRLFASAALLAIFGAAAPSVPAGAQELSALGGIVSGNGAGTSYSWQLNYRNAFVQHLSWGLSYLNEGHLPQHHRDGYAPMLWTGFTVAGGDIDLSAGAGPYLFFDTVNGTQNKHGLKALTSVAATWYRHSDWFFQLRGNAAVGGEEIDTYTALAGVGYRFSGQTKQGETEQPPPPLHPNELALLIGHAILNNTGSEQWSALGVEYRRRVLSHADVTLSGLLEGDTSRIRRYGVMAQVWGMQDLVPNKLSVGIGAGPYLKIASHRAPPSGSRASGVVTLTGSYAFLDPWVVRASWNRFYTNDDSDSDLIVAAIGYRF